METTAATGSAVYVASNIKSERPRKSKRHRRTKDQIKGVRAAIEHLLAEDHPQTVRQVFYALTVRGLIGKLEVEYQRTAVRLLGEMREAGTIPFEWIADNTRWQRKPTTFVGIEACLNATAKHYRRDLWAAMPVYVEVWCEKDALAGVLMEETEPYDVPLMVAKGYASLSFLHSAAMMIRAKKKPAHIYHFGDLDPSGVDAARDIEAKLRRYAPEATIHFERPAVTREQVEQWNLPTRPTNLPTAGRRSSTAPRRSSLTQFLLPNFAIWCAAVSSDTSTIISFRSCVRPRRASVSYSRSGPRPTRGYRSMVEDSRDRLG
jgi:hypothetical protein